MLEQVVDWNFEGMVWMVMKVVDLGFEIEGASLVEEGNIVMEKKNKVVGIEDFYHKDFSNLVPKMDFEVARAKVSKG